MNLRKNILEAAFRLASGITKPKDGWGEWVLLSQEHGLVNQGHNIRLEIPLEGVFASPNEVLCVHEWTLRSLLPTLAGEFVSLTRESAGYLKLEAQGLTSKIPTLDVASYPPHPVRERPNFLLRLATETLKNAFERVEFAIATDVDSATKLAFTGITLRSEGPASPIEVIGARDPLIAVTKILGREVPAFSASFPRELALLVRKLQAPEVVLSKYGTDWVLEAQSVVRAYFAEIPRPLPDINPAFACPTQLRIEVLKPGLKAALHQIGIFREKSRRIVSIVVERAGIVVHAASQVSGRARSRVPAVVTGLPEGQTVAFGVDLDYLCAIVDRMGTEPDAPVTLALGAQRELLRVDTAQSSYLTVTASPDPDDQ